MKQIIYKFCTSLPSIPHPTYTVFKKLNLTMQQSIQFLSQAQSLRDTSEKALALTTMLTYIRKKHSRQFLKSRQEIIQTIIDSIETYDERVLPALIANVEYTYQPELYLTQCCTLLNKFAPQMSIKALSNCLYSLSKIARRNVSFDNQKEKVMVYNGVVITAQGLSTLVKLKIIDCTDITTLVELLIAYEKMELVDLQENLLEQLSQIKFSKFGRIESQLAHTIHKNEIQTALSTQIMRQLYDCLEEGVHKKQITLQSMILGVNACFDLVTKELIEECQQYYIEQYTKANIQDLGMMTGLLMRKGVMSEGYSKQLTESYEALRQNVDINILNQLIQNMGTIINLRLLEKKFINMFLISVKVYIYMTQFIIRFQLTKIRQIGHFIYNFYRNIGQSRMKKSKISSTK